jgi:hypothetical protein
MKILKLRATFIVILVFVLAASFREKSNAVVKAIPLYKFYAFPPQFLQSNLPTLPSVTHIYLNYPVLIYSTSVNLTISEALEQTPNLDFCTADACYLCAAKVRDINGSQSVIEATEGDFYSF